MFSRPVFFSIVVALVIPSAQVNAFAQSVPPIASPSPSPNTGVPEPQASASAAPGQGPATVPPGLILTRAAVIVAPRQIAAVGVSGANGAIEVRVSNAFAIARFDASTSSIVVTGVALGTALVTVTDAAGASAALSVSVLPPAGTIASDVTVNLGGVVSPQFALARVNAAIVRASQMQPGAVLTVRGLTIANTLQAGDELEGVARVTVTAGTAFADQAAPTAVHLHVETLDKLEPAFLLYSDDPERLGAASDGVAYRGTIDVSKPARVYAYHVSDTPARKLFLVLHTAGSASIQVLGYAAGPADAFAYVGHVSTLNYLLERSTQESAIVDVTAAAPYVAQLGYRSLSPGELVAAIFDVRVLSGDPVDVEVISTSGADDPISRIGDTELPDDGHGRRGEFDLTTVPPLSVSYTIGDPEPSPFAIGYPTIANLRPGGRALGGDYGVLRNVRLQLSNPAASPQNVYFYQQAAGGTATTTIWFAGDPKPIELPCIRAQNRYLVKTFTLDAGETRAVGGEYMTDGSSSFPLNFGLTPTPPSPVPGPYSPDVCNPKTPPATPSPLPSPSVSPETSAGPGDSPTP